MLDSSNFRQSKVLPFQSLFYPNPTNPNEWVPGYSLKRARLKISEKQVLTCLQSNLLCCYVFLMLMMIASTKKKKKKRKERSFVVYIYFYLVKGALGQLREL